MTTPTRAQTRATTRAAVFVALASSACGVPTSPDAAVDARADAGLDAVVADDAVPGADARDAAPEAAPDAPPVAAPSSGVLYAPDPGTNADEEDSYPHAIRLRSSGAILATFERQLTSSSNPGRGWLVYRSTDDGVHFARLGVPVQPAHFAGATFALQPNLVELAHASGSLPAGTVLLAGVTGAGTQQEMQLFRSGDAGATWQYLSAIDATNTASSPRRIWEPFVLQLDDARLVAFYSDELTPGGRQNIVARVSSDGGATWGASSAIWASSNDGDRPGMSTVARMGDGRYAMTVEMCGAPGDYCRVHIKFSTDGLHWGASAQDLGVRPAPATGHLLHGNPFVAWTPAGGAQGTLIVSGRDLQESLAMPDTAAGGHGQTLLVNYGNGAGAWYEFTAPIAWSAGAAYTQAGYRNALLPSVSGASILYFTSTYTGSGPRNRVVYATAPGPSLPYQAPFGSDVATGWQGFGGAWSVRGGVFTDASAGAGDKAVAGSTGWRDYVLAGDVQLAGAGNAGFLLRVTNPNVGADTLDGWFVGVSTQDGTAFVGREQHAWTLLGATHPVTGGVSAGAWYHVVARATGCALDVTVSPAAGGAAPTHFTQTDAGCTMLSGAIGVRTFGTSASWRNVSVAP